MAEAPPIRITLELHSPGEPLDGCVCAPNGAARPFSGWLGLIAAVEKVRSTRADGEQDVREAGH